MPKRAKKAAESETAKSEIAEARSASETVAAAGAKAEAEAEEQPKKPARKKRAKMPASVSAAAAAGADLIIEPVLIAGDVEAELAAQAADAFDDAFHSKAQHDAQAEAASEGSAGEPAQEPEKRAADRKPTRKTKPKAKGKPKAEAKSKPGTEPENEPEPQADEADEMEGDWESGSGPGPDAEEHEEGAGPALDSDIHQDREPRPAAKLERLQKILSRAGVASRRHAEEMITGGRVQVNGKVVTELGSKADPARDHIRVDGKLLHGAERLRYFVLNKPRGYVTTVSDPEGRPTVMEFFSKMGERLYPVGRLDYQSEGLLLMTNDGELANQLTRAASGVEKTYLVKVSGQPDAGLIDALREGVRIDRGKPGEGSVRTAPARIQQVRRGENPWFEVGLIEGRNRELRKMFEEIGHHVEKIRRVGYGPLVLDLEPGRTRELDQEELRLLRLAAEGKWKPRRIKASAMLPPEAGRSMEFDAANRGRRPMRRDEQGRDQPGRARGFGDRPREKREFGDRFRRPGQGGGGGSAGQERGQRQESRGFVPGRRTEGGPGQGRQGPGRGVEGSAGGGRPFERDRGQRGGRGGAPIRGERPFRGRPEGGERPPFQRREFKGGTGREGLREGFGDRGPRPARGGFRPAGGAGRGAGQGAIRGRGSDGSMGGGRPFRGRPEGGERPLFQRRELEERLGREGAREGAGEGLGARGSRPARGGFRPGRGDEQRQGQRRESGQRFGAGAGRESGSRGGQRGGQGAGKRFGQGSGEASSRPFRQGSGRPGMGPGREANREGGRGGFSGRRSGPPKAGGRRPPDGGRGPRRP